MGVQFVYAAVVSFALAVPVSHLIRFLSRHAVDKVACAGLSGVEVVLVAGSAWLAATTSTAATVRALRLPVNCAWTRMALMTATPLLPCAFFSFRYQQAADSVAAFWSHALGLLLAVLFGLQAGHQETEASTGGPQAKVTDGGGSPSEMPKA